MGKVYRGQLGRRKSDCRDCGWYGMGEKKKSRRTEEQEDWRGRLVYLLEAHLPGPALALVKLARVISGVLVVKGNSILSSRATPTTRLAVYAKSAMGFQSSSAYFRTGI